MIDKTPELTVRCMICLTVLDTKPSTVNQSSDGLCSSCDTVCYHDPKNEHEAKMFRETCRTKMQQILKTNSLDDPRTLRSIRFLRERILNLTAQ